MPSRVGSRGRLVQRPFRRAGAPGLEENAGCAASTRLPVLEALAVVSVVRRRPALAALLLAAAGALAACGGAGTPTPSAAASTLTPSASTPTASVAPTQCPSGSTIGSALGITLPNATSVAGSGANPLPAGATEVVCEYRGASDNVIIVLIANISASYISLFSAHFPGGYKTLAGVGDQARSFVQSLGGGKDNEGIVAVKGSTIVSIDATYTPATLAQLGALVNRLL